MGWTSFGVRDGILLLVVLAAVYLVIMLLRLIRVRRHVPQQQGPAAQEEPPLAKREETSMPRQSLIAMPEEQSSSTAAGAAAEETKPDQPFAVPSAPTFEWSEVRDLFGEASPPTPSPPAQRTGGFGEHLAEHLARADMEMEMQRMRDEMERMRAEMEELRAARRVSPQYAEAMELVQRGLTAQDVADRLGISLAEAELVHALGQGRQNFDEGDEHGADADADRAAGFDAFSQHRSRRG